MNFVCAILFDFFFLKSYILKFFLCAKLMTTCNFLCETAIQRVIDLASKSTMYFYQCVVLDLFMSTMTNIITCKQPTTNCTKKIIYIQFANLKSNAYFHASLHECIYERKIKPLSVFPCIYICCVILNSLIYQQHSYVTNINMVRKKHRNSSYKI